MKKLKHGKKTGLKYFNIQDIRSWSPCYDPNIHLSEDFKGTALTTLKNETVPAVDRLRIVLRTEIVSEKLMRLFAVWCYRETLVFVKNHDEISLNAANTAESYALGLATHRELSVASTSIYAASYAPRSYAYYTAHNPASYAAYAAYSYAYASGYSTASVSSSYAADTSSYYSAAAYAASNPTDFAASEKNMRDKQIKKLIEMIIIEGKERVKK